MASGAISILTRGMIFFCPQEDQIISLDRPQIKRAIEVRPKIRRVAGAVTLQDFRPAITATLELRPLTTEVAAPGPVIASDPPATTEVRELRPIIRKIEEE